MATRDNNMLINEVCAISDLARLRRWGQARAAWERIADRVPGSDRKDTLVLWLTPAPGTENGDLSPVVVQQAAIYLSIWLEGWAAGVP